MNVDTEALAARMAEKFPQEQRKPKEKRKPGRPVGSKGRHELPTQVLRRANIRHADPSTLIERQFLIAEWMQAAFREEMRRRMEGPGIILEQDDVKRFEGLTMSLNRAVNTLKQSADLADELASRMTADQLLDATLKKIEAQEPAFVRYAVKRLKAHLDLVVPKADPGRVPLGTAVDAMASLGD